MKKNVTFELKSDCPIEVVYGLSAESLELLKAENKDAEGYHWCIALDETADQREEFLSGNDLDDAILAVTDMSGNTINFRFMHYAEYDLEEELGEDLSDVIKYDETIFHQAGLNLDVRNITHIVVTRTELKSRKWKFTAQINGDFRKENVTLKVKCRDSDVAIASTIYRSWRSEFEGSITGAYYDGLKIPFDIDFTSYAPEFMCLKKTSNGWERDTKLEQFFEGVG